MHDKVMQQRNNYDKEVFNGDIGIIVNVDTEENELTVDFDGRHITYDVTELDELTLAYATTIHKAQGSEYPIVVMPFTMSHYVMLQRNLLYTGVTRAKKILVLIGEKKAIAYATRNETTTSRNTKLAERIANGWKDAVKVGLTQKEADELYSYYQNNQDRDELPMVAEQTAPYGRQSDSSKVGFSDSGSDKPTDRYTEPLSDLFDRLSRSKFRSSFSLKQADTAYVRNKGMDTIRSHACDFIRLRLAPEEPKNDGKQTPMKHVHDSRQQIMGEGHASPLHFGRRLTIVHWTISAARMRDSEWRGSIHPVFIAQHATGCCCRGCLEKWHRIPKGIELTGKQQEYVVDVLMAWIERQMEANERSQNQI